MIEEIEKYSPTQIKLLLILNERRLSQSDISRRYWNLSKEKKEAITSDLIVDGLVMKRLCPTLKSKKIPTFYSLTEKGRSWVESYLEV